MTLYLSVADAARVLGVTPQTVRLMARTGRLPVAAKTVGGIQLFGVDDVERLAAARGERARRIADATVSEIKGTVDLEGDHAVES